MKRFRLPVAVDARLLCHLSRLSINCLDNISFHRAVALLSSVFSQLSRLSLKLDAYTLAQWRSQDFLSRWQFTS